MNPNTSPLLLSERHTSILKTLQQHGSVSVSALAEMLKVSEVTIRKDLSLLEQYKKLYRSHGSAILISPYISDRHVNEKEGQYVAEKMAIAAKAVEAITPRDSIILASGTTITYFAQAIKADQPLTVVSASLPASSILLQNKNIEVYQLGGLVRNSAMSVIGGYAEMMLKNICCSKLFLGVDGIDIDYGLTTSNVMEANLNRAMMEATQKVIILADSSKFGRIGFSKISNIESVDEIITDTNIPPAILDRLTGLGVSVTTVSLFSKTNE